MPTKRVLSQYDNGVDSEYTADTVLIWNRCREMVGRGEIPTLASLREELPDVPLFAIKKQLLTFRIRNRGSGLGLQ